MRLNSMFHVLTFLTATLISSTPLLVLAQVHQPAQPEYQRRETQPQNQEEPKYPQTVADQAIRDAERDVENDINRPMWFALGCLFPGVGLLTPYFYSHPIPQSRLLGKSPEYVAYYTDTYKRKSVSSRFGSACLGTGVGAGVYVISITLLLTLE